MDQFLCEHRARRTDRVIIGDGTSIDVDDVLPPFSRTRNAATAAGARATAFASKPRSSMSAGCGSIGMPVAWSNVRGRCRGLRPGRLFKGTGNSELIQGKRTQHGKPQGVVSDYQPDAREGQAGRPGVAERFVVPLKPGNAGGGKNTGAPPARSGHVALLHCASAAAKYRAGDRSPALNDVTASYSVTRRESKIRRFCEAAKGPR